MTPTKVIALEEHFTSSKLRALRGEKDTGLNMTRPSDGQMDRHTALKS
jgi:hypothetical protein